MKKSLLLKLVPSSVRITKKIRYEIVFIDEFPNAPAQLGEVRFKEKQIVIKKGQTPEETYSTYKHELIHTFCHVYKIGLTEQQVLNLEKGIFVYEKLNKILEKLVKES